MVLKQGGGGGGGGRDIKIEREGGTERDYEKHLFVIFTSKIFQFHSFPTFCFYKATLAGSVFRIFKKIHFQTRILF